LQEHRGKGLARAVVLAVLDKCAQRHKQESRKCAPYVYIESSNDASKALFTSLGFTKCNDVVWAGLTLSAES
jgi:L-amino acid N-acyltransferase YncA